MQTDAGDQSSLQQRFSLSACSAKCQPARPTFLAPTSLGALNLPRFSCACSPRIVAHVVDLLERRMCHGFAPTAVLGCAIVGLSGR